MPTSAPQTLVQPALMDLLLSEHLGYTRPRLERLWHYYRNPAESDGGQAAANSLLSASRCAQARGLPARLTRTSPHNPREIVIENDIAWRIHTLVDFMFGKPLVIQSLADDPKQRTAITRLLRDTFRANGGEGFFHDLALLGSVYGYVDVLVRPNPQTNASASPIQLDLIEAPRAIPVLNPGDYRRLDAYLIHHPQLTHDVEQQPFLNRLLRKPQGPSRKAIERTEIWTDESFETFVSHKAVTGKRQSRVDAGVNRLGRLPVVHIQNLAQPFFYEGLSDVESLIPLQDELNTRLSDRANRVTFQSLKMYLGKRATG